MSLQWPRKDRHVQVMQKKLKHILPTVSVWNERGRNTSHDRGHANYLLNKTDPIQSARVNPLSFSSEPAILLVGRGQKLRVIAANITLDDEYPQDITPTDLIPDVISNPRAACDTSSATVANILGQDSTILLFPRSPFSPRVLLRTPMGLSDRFEADARPA